MRAEMELMVPAGVMLRSRGGGQLVRFTTAKWYATPLVTKMPQMMEAAKASRLALIADRTELAERQEWTEELREQAEAPAPLSM